ncbi:trehalase [Drosophila santomea]|uniref:trehalase n=1 Tax=Drosophila santomea TaxID=129105 RepID=UPI001953CD0D|nr:trehalase [Drosophila santomea]
MANNSCWEDIGGENRSVFCEGPLLDAVQRSKMFPDCKHFVDMSCIYTPAQTLNDFDMFTNCCRNDGSLRFLQMFVEKHFNDPGSELEHWTPPDWKEEPSFLARIGDPELKKFGSAVNGLWKELGRRIKDEVKENPDQYSILYVPNPFIVPSSNCREYRYWESFWIVRGLLQCGMHQTARGMIDNYLELVQQFGFVPGCGRIYCSGRSNPPLLIMMVKAYVEVTKDEQYAIEALPLLETEYETFTSKHSVQVKGRTMYQYRDFSAGPRPEAYREDLECVANIKSPLSRELMYTELKSAAESGTNFSSRWFVSVDGSNKGSFRDTKTSAIVPVELNCIVFRSGKILAEFNRKAGNTKKADEYQERACGLVRAIRNNLWNAQAGIWLDYDLVNNKPRNYFCCTNFAPLWARAFPLVDTDKVSKGVMQYIKTNELDAQYGGVPYTMNKETGQDWDHPNVFPPMMFLIVEGLENLGTPPAKAMSKRWAHRWVKSNYAAYKYESFMFEKYYCDEFGTSGGVSPEHTPVGYGWTNGVIIEFLCKYGKEISLADNSDEGSKSKSRGSKTTGKYDYIITSEANMEDQPTKKKCVCGDPSTAAVRSNRSTATTATSDFSQQTQPQPQVPKKDDCSCGIAQKQRSQTQPGEDGKCSCGAGAQEKSQQQLQATDATSCGKCGSQKQQPSQVQMQRSQQQGHDAQCPCSGKVAPQQQEALGMQHDPDCPLSGQQQKGAELIVVPSQVPKDDPDCECSMDDRQKQQHKQQDCMRQQQQQQQQQERQKQQQLQSEQQQDCSTKPDTQDCSKHLKKSSGACGCMDDEDDRHDALTGHYFPVADKDPDEFNGLESKSPQRESGCDGCGRSDCPDPPQEDNVSRAEGKPQQMPVQGYAQTKASQHTAANDCSCAVGKSQSKAASVAPAPTFICPHCGGITSEAFLSTTNRAQDDCDSKAGGGQSLRGLPSKGMQSGHSKVAPGVGGPECAPCKAHVTADFPPGHGPKPLFNKQFPLADPVSTFDACPANRGSDAANGKKKKKCCNCDEKEDGE